MGEEKYLLLLDSLPHGVLMIQDGGVEFANKTAAEILGFDRGEDLVGRRCLDFVTDSEQGRFADHFQRILEGGSDSPGQWQTILCGRTGRHIDAEIRANQVTFKNRRVFQLVVTDITDRPRSPVRMKLLSAALEQMREGFAFVDLEGRLGFSNHAFADMHGYGIEELLGQHVAVLLPGEELMSLAAANEETRRAGVFSGEFVHCRKDGVAFPVFTTISPIRDDRGSPVGTIMTVRDATGAKISERILNQVQQEAFKHSSRLEERVLALSRQLADSRRELNESAKSLGQANEALRLMISSTGDQNREREQTVSRNLDKTIFTILDQLRAEKLPDVAKHLLDFLEFNLNSLFSGSVPIAPPELALLTPHETRLCEFIRAGLSSKQIADVMGGSAATVDFHRYQIRKKLGLVGSDDNLARYLRSKT